MKGITVSPVERMLLANTALDIKYEGKDAPVTPEKFLFRAVMKINKPTSGQLSIQCRKI
jgi:hypothetical protein